MTEKFKLFQRVSHPSAPDGGLVYMGPATVISHDEPPYADVLPLLQFDMDFDDRQRYMLRMPTSSLKTFTLPTTRKPRNLAAFAAMCRTAIIKGMPRNHQGDLTEAAAYLLGVHPNMVRAAETKDGQPFGWILRAHGCEVCPMKAGDMNPALHWNSQYYLYYWWDGNALTEVESAQVIVERCQ